MKTIESKSSDQTYNLGIMIGQNITQGTCIALKGELGAGKTTFVQGLAKGIGVFDQYYVTSPTYNIINEYPTQSFKLCHLDLYRLGSADELEYIGFDDLLDENNIIVVEWPDLLNDISFKFDIEINFKFNEEYNRMISIIASGQCGSNLLSKLTL